MGTIPSKTRISKRLIDSPRNSRSCFDDTTCNVKGAFLKISRVQVMLGKETASSWILLTDDITGFANVNENGRLVFCNRIASVKMGRSHCSWIVETVWKARYEFLCSDLQEAIEWRSAVLALAREENNLAAIVSFEDKDLSEQLRARIRRYMHNYSFMYRRPEFLATTCFGTKEERPILSCRFQFLFTHKPSLYTQTYYYTQALPFETLDFVQCLDMPSVGMREKVKRMKICVRFM